MADTVSKNKRSEIMSAVKSKNTKMEIAFRKTLWQEGFRFSKNSSKYFGKPDIILRKYKTVIFLDSCFWHGCKKHCRFPSSRRKYWIEKINQNIKRDKEVSEYYKRSGWKIYRIWEHEINNKKLKTVVLKLVKKIKKHEVHR